jgi:YD repeat-containing protein
MSLYTRSLSTRVSTSIKAARKQLKRAKKRVPRSIPKTPKQFISISLMLMMLSVQAPAAPVIAATAATEMKNDLRFWYHSSGWADSLNKLLFNRKALIREPQENQSDRNAKITRVDISPKDVIARVGETIQFAAIAYDYENGPIGGIKFRWDATDATGQKAQIPQTGAFKARQAGDFTISVSASGYTASVNVKVEPVDEVPGADPYGRKGRSTSSRDLPYPHISSIKPKKKQSSGHGVQFTKASFTRATKPVEPVMPQGTCTDAKWADCNYWSADDPINGRGAPPAKPTGPGSSNYSFSVPIISLPGRGPDLNLALTYNSQLWNKANTDIVFDIDHDWPAPGWEMGFGKIIRAGGTSGSILIDPDGTRHSWKGTWTTSSRYDAQTTDGTFIDYYHTESSGVMTGASAKFPNGTEITYGAQSGGIIYPTKIMDASGNYITITYTNNTGPGIDTITDTLGRVLQFYYTSGGKLTAITAPGLNGGTRTLVRIRYKDLSPAFSFSGLSARLRTATVKVIDGIYFPATQTGYWFAASDSFSGYGMMTKVESQRGMSFSSSGLTDQGTITQGTLTSRTTYDFQTSGSLTDAPTYTSKTDTWDSINTTAPTTSYSVSSTSSATTTTLTRADGTKLVSVTKKNAGQYDDGILEKSEVYDSSNNLMSRTAYTYAMGDYDSPRVTRVEVTDERNQTTATAYEYGTSKNQVSELKEYDFGGTTLLRRTHTDYENSTNYTNRHIFNLPTNVEVYAADNTTKVSKTTYQYDQTSLTNCSGITQHEASYNPHSGSYNSATAYRGNVTTVTTYSDAVNATGAITTTNAYDIGGNVRTESTSCCEQTSFDYTSTTQFAYPTSSTRGASDPNNTSARNTTSATYNFNTGLMLTSTDENSRTTTNTYNADTLRVERVDLPTGAYSTISYDDSAMSSTASTYLSGGTLAGQSITRLNGLGLVKKTESLAPNSAWDLVETTYDVLGRVWKTTRPYRSGDTVQLTENFYDAMDRLTKVVGPEGSEVKSFYNESTRPPVASSTAGNTTRVQDAWGRERWGRTDALGRLVEVVEPNPSGTGAVSESGGLATTYSYDTLGNLTQVSQGSQTRTFKYDSVGRLTHQKLAEKSATLNDSGTYVGSGTWSDYFTYDTRSNMTSATDARGIKTVFGFSSDPLNRIQSVSYDSTGFGDTANAVETSPTTSYTYKTTGDVTRVDTITVSNVATEAFTY